MLEKILENMNEEAQTDQHCARAPLKSFLHVSLEHVDPSERLRVLGFGTVLKLQKALRSSRHGI